MSSAPTHIINPLTNKNIKIGGRVYKKLLKEGHIKLDEMENLMQGKQEEENFPEEEKKEEPEIDIITVPNPSPAPKEDVETPSSPKFAKISFEDLIENNDERIAKLVAEATDNVVKKHKSNLESIEDEDDLKQEVMNLINEELQLMLE